MQPCGDAPRQDIPEFRDIRRYESQLILLIRRVLLAWLRTYDITYHKRKDSPSEVVPHEVRTCTFEVCRLSPGHYKKIFSMQRYSNFEIMVNEKDTFDDFFPFVYD